MNATFSTLLEEFSRHRHDLLMVLDRGSELAKALGKGQERVKPLLDTARQTIDYSRLNLVIIGAEGHGKSTLINSIMGHDLTPREEQIPGTVAPVHLQWSTDKSPVYTVIREGHENPINCTADEFRGYLLQKNNSDNKAEVIRGIVSIDHPILAKGLRLVDMPGIEGVSQTIAIEAQHFIKTEAHGVVAVVRDRSYGALVRTLSDISGKELQVHAVISNWSLDQWDSRVDADMRKFISEQKQVVTDYLRREHNKSPVHPNNVFVLHLPSFCSMQSGEPPRVKSAVHHEEAEAFLRFIWGYVRSRGIREVIAESARHAEYSLLELEHLLGVRCRLLDQILKNGSSAAHEIVEQYDRAIQQADAYWKQVYTSQVIMHLADDHWPSMKQALDDTRARITDHIHVMRRQVEQQEGKIRKAEAASLQNSLRQKTAEAMENLQVIQEQTLGNVADSLCVHANEALDIFFQAMPVLQNTVNIPLDRHGLQEFAIANLNPSWRDKLFKYGLSSAASTLGGMVAGGKGMAVLVGVAGMGPVGAMVAGAAGAGILAWGLINILRDENRPAVLRGLERALADAQAIDTSSQGPLQKKWRETVEGISVSVNAFLYARLQEVRALIVDPKSDRSRLVEEQRVIKDSLAAVRELVQRVEVIESTAGNIKAA